ncbi:MAG TPA: diguanylate cyclase [Bacillota bacterium]|nr:diguanylate cyclase [Bacillota bacterium]
MEYLGIGALFLVFLIGWIKCRSKKQTIKGDYQLSNIIHSIPDFIYLKDGNGRWMEANKFAARLFQIEDFPYKGKRDIEIAEYSPYFRETLLSREGTEDQLWELGNIIRKEKTISNPEGSLSIFDVMKIPMFHEDGRRKGLLVIGRDITNRKQVEETLIESEKGMRFITENTTDVISRHSMDGKFIYVSPACERITGYSTDELIGRSTFNFIHPEDAMGVLRLLSKSTNSTEDMMGSATFRFRFRKKDRKYIWVETSARSVGNIPQFPEGVIAVSRDITQRKLFEKKLKETNETLHKLSSLDGLTSIANRRYFDEFLQKEWHRSIRDKLPISLIIFDIDYFKRFNDTYGHLKGDDCLQQVAKAVEETFKRATDLVARYGGEEFAVVLPNTSSEVIYPLADKLRSNIENLMIPHENSNASSYVTVSIGVATVFPKRNSHPEELIHHADTALYQAKNAGRNQVKLYFSEMNVH